MSTNSKIYQQIELAFWDWFINELSESDTVRLIIAVAYRITADKRYAQARTAFLITGMGGICFGILTALLATHLR